MCNDASCPNMMFVAPFTGAWIEIFVFCDYQQTISVAPFTGAWIEMRSPRR